MRSMLIIARGKEGVMENILGFVGTWAFFESRGSADRRVQNRVRTCQSLRKTKKVDASDVWRTGNVDRCVHRMGLDRTSVEGLTAALQMIVSGNVDVQALKDGVIAPQVNEVIAAVAGGTVGVMASLTIFEKRIQEVKERLRCCYCRGVGALPCGSCYTTGCVPTPGATNGKSPCGACTERGYIVCEHCNGSGRALPYEYERRARIKFFLPDEDEYYNDKYNPFN